jgi:aminoglycoside phosphotransferase (APT) family kinase protein
MIEGIASAAPKAQGPIISTMTATPPTSAAAAPAAALEFDAHALRTWLLAQLPGLQGPMALERIAGGQSNPTFFVNFSKHSMVLRKQPTGTLLPSAHAVDREYKVMRALAGSPVPVPQMLAYCEDRSVIGTPFYVMERLQGRVMASVALPEVAVPQRRAHCFAMMETLAALHQVNWQAVGLADFGKPGNYFQRQVTRWTAQWQASKTAENAHAQHLIEWLPANIPPGDASTIAHGDFRMGNVMFHPTEPRIVGVLDWELATLGHPMADLAYCCMPWVLEPDQFDGVLGKDFNAEGLPTLKDMEAHYQRSGGCAEPLLPFHLAFSMFRLFAILDGVAARAKAGTAASANAAAVGARAAALARRAVELIA